ncbi:hypothetical protein D3C85_1735150 [compost metagenome]
MLHQIVQFVPFCRVPQPFAFVTGDELCDGLGMPGFAEDYTNFLGSDFLIGVAVEDGD